MSACNSPQTLDLPFGMHQGADLHHEDSWTHHHRMIYNHETWCLADPQYLALSGTSPMSSLPWPHLAFLLDPMHSRPVRSAAPGSIGICAGECQGWSLGTVGVPPFLLPTKL